MSLEEIKTKLERGEVITPEEQKELLLTVQSEFSKLREENPQKYLELVEGMTTIIHDLNNDLSAA